MSSPADWDAGDVVRGVWRAGDLHRDERAADPGRPGRRQAPAAAALDSHNNSSASAWETEEEDIIQEQSFAGVFSCEKIEGIDLNVVVGASGGFATQSVTVRKAQSA